MQKYAISQISMCSSHQDPKEDQDSKEDKDQDSKEEVGVAMHTGTHGVIWYCQFLLSCLPMLSYLGIYEVFYIYNIQAGEQY